MIFGLETEMDRARVATPFSNGTAGDAWMGRWCQHCAHDNPARHPDTSGCPLLGVALLGLTPNAWQPDRPRALGHQYICTEFLDDPMSTHACPGGCGQQIERDRFACPTDWYALPDELRDAILRNYRRDEHAHMQAMSEALDWYHARTLTPAGSRKIENGQTYEWTGKAWRHVPRSELDRERWRRQ